VKVEPPARRVHQPGCIVEVTRNDRILVVEDDDGSRNALAALLVDHGFEVDSAQNGVEALELVADRTPALIISDVRMPRGGGLAMVRELRARAASEDIPIILVSADSARDRRVAGLDIGADDFLGKPLDPDELMARVRVHLRHAHRQDELRRRAVIDPLTGLLNRDGIFAVLRRAQERGARDPESVGALVLDVDRFKKLNDDHGHAAGDTALRMIARALVDAVRVADHVGRIGGDEFLVVLPEGGEAGARALADRLRSLALPPLAVGPDRELAVTMSVGCAVLKDGESLDSLVERADAAMYRAKRASR